MRCYLLAVRIFRTRCFIVLFLMFVVFFLVRVFQHKRSRFFTSIFWKHNSDYDFFRPFYSNFSKSHQFTPGEFLIDYIPHNISYCNFNYGLPSNFNIKDTDIEYPPELGSDSEYRVVYNITKSVFVTNNSLEVTYCTHATPEFLYFLSEILKRWQGPVSIAIFVPSTDISLALCIIERLCGCLPGMSRASLHFIFPSKFPPKLTKCSVALQMPDGCAIPYALKTKTLQTFRRVESLIYPVNVARNVARINVRTSFILVSDVELFPSTNLEVNFIKMISDIQKESGAELEGASNKLVYVLPVFEVESGEEVPGVKSKLLELYSQSRAFYFHRWICSHCQRFPGLQRWLLRKSPLLDHKIEPFFVVRREFPFHRWEPVFIGTNGEPLYSEGLSWEGQQDKMTQMHEMCLLRYRFVILDGAFMVHAPGVKRKTDIVKDGWRIEQQKINNLHYDNIISSITSRQKHNPRCKISKRKRRDTDESETNSQCNTKEETDEANSRSGGPQTPTSPEDISEGFSTVDLSPNHPSMDSERADQPTSRGGQFFDRIKHSSVGKLFKTESNNKDQDISIYTINSSRERPVDVEEGSLETEDLNSLENSTMVSMATDLRLLDPEEEPWDDVLIKYFTQHREEILELTKNGYRDETFLWTFPGSILSAVSILTTFGLGAHLPQTMGGIITAVIFACFGIPIHTVFILNLGRTIAVKVQLFAKELENKATTLRQRIINVRRFGEDRKKRETWPEDMFFTDFKPPYWLAYFPLLSSLAYYSLGLLVFGLARGLPTSQLVVFFGDFSRGEASNGFSRMGYAWYLEGAAILLGLNLALLRDSPVVGLSEILQPYGIVTNSLD